MVAYRRGTSGCLRGVIFFLFSSLDGLVADGIETYGSEATKTKVVVDETEISPISGKVALRGLKIGNPEIFKNENNTQGLAGCYSLLAIVFGNLEV